MHTNVVLEIFQELERILKSRACFSSHAKYSPLYLQKIIGII